MNQIYALPHKEEVGSQSNIWECCEMQTFKKFN